MRRVGGNRVTVRRVAPTALFVVVAVAFAVWAGVLLVTAVQPPPLNLGVPCGSVVRPAARPAGLITDCSSVLAARRRKAIDRGVVAGAAAVVAGAAWVIGRRSRSTTDRTTALGA